VNWPDLVDTGVFIAGSLLGGGSVTAIIIGFFHKPKERALTEKEKALAEKERALAAATKADTSIELVRLWMVSNDKLSEANARLEKYSERIQKSNERLQREMYDTRRVLISLVDVIEQFMPLLQRSVGEEEMQKLNAVLIRARAFDE
jgi:hypothetical protein